MARCKHERVVIKEYAEEVLTYVFQRGQLIHSGGEAGKILPAVDVECLDCLAAWHYTHRHMPKWVATLLEAL